MSVLRENFGFLLGVTAAVVVMLLPTPEGLSLEAHKTAALFLAAAKIGSIITAKENKYKDALESYGKNLGLTFQIADDTLDYNSDLKIFGKNIGNDFF